MSQEQASTSAACQDLRRRGRRWTLPGGTTLQRVGGGWEAQDGGLTVGDPHALGALRSVRKLRGRQWWMRGRLYRARMRWAHRRGWCLPTPSLIEPRSVHCDWCGMWGKR